MTRQGRARQAGLCELPTLPCTGEVFTVTLAVVLSMPMANFRIRPSAPDWNQVWTAAGGSVAGLGPLPSVHLTPRTSSESILPPCMNVCVFHACADSAAPLTHYSHGQFRPTPSLRSAHTHSQVYTHAHIYSCSQVYTYLCTCPQTDTSGSSCCLWPAAVSTLPFCLPLSSSIPGPLHPFPCAGICTEPGAHTCHLGLILGGYCPGVCLPARVGPSLLCS